jgi:hypothetical protein
MPELSDEMKLALKAQALERYRIIELLIDQEVIRRDAFGTLVFHNEGFLYAKDIVGLEPEDTFQIR